MEDFMSPEDEFEMLHAAEMEIMKEIEEERTAISQPQEALCDDVLANWKQDKNEQTRKRSREEEAEERTSGVRRRLLDDSIFPIDQSISSKRPRRPLLPIVRGLDEEIMSSRQRSQLVDPDIVLLNQIEEHKQMLRQQMLQNNRALASASKLTDSRQFSFCKIHRRIPEGEFQSVTSNEGERVYLSVRDEDAGNSSSSRVNATRCPPTSQTTSGQLLQVPYAQLKEAALAELQRQAERLVRAQEPPSSPSLMSIEDEEEEENDKENDSAALWTDLYRPTHYLHLLSDEMTNRSVLHWIKLWDKCVFGIEKKPRKPKENQGGKRDNWKDKKGGKFQYRQPILLPDLREDLEPDGRPAQKLLLLCGAPGLGKTTLAHIIAKHAGYRPVELNASDDRSVDAFRSSIENATSMRSVIDADRRPNCLIIDEIDGAPAPSIKLLVNLISGKGLGGKAPSKKGAKEKVFVLQRPVIAICNDLYVPALRPLRPLALVVNFPPTMSTKLAQRLQQVCAERSLRTDLTCLLALAHKTHNDIRSCLSLLQFVRSKRGVLKLTDLEGASVGQKDYQQSLFGVWNQIFSIPRPVKARRVNPHDLPLPATNSGPAAAATNQVSEVTLSDRYREVLQAAMSCSEYDRILQGWFENYPNCKFKHMHLEPVTSGLEWACFLDLIRTEINTSQSWMLQSYLPHVFVSLHLNFASHQRPKISFPVQHTEQTAVQQRSETLMATLLQHMSPSNRVYVAASLLLLDILPYMSTILQPNFRPINTQLYSAREKTELLDVIDTMIAFNLTYTQEKSKEGHYSFVMEPNIEDLVHFDTEAGTRKQLGYTVRQLVAREVEMEKVRRAELYFSQQEQEKKVNPKRDSLASAPQSVPSASKDEYVGGISDRDKKIAVENKSAASEGADEAADNQGSKEDGSVPNHLRKLKAKPLPKVSETNILRDFFGRPIEVPASQREKARNDIVKSDVWFRFKEGYSNAVRRTVKMKDLC